MKKVNLSIEKKSYGVREAIRTLRTNLQFCGDDKRVILVTSCVPREGKSSVSVALAESIADMGKSVILVDADIRNSVMASKLQITGADKGLSHFLSGQCVLADVIMATNIPKFHILLSGPEAPNPTELLESNVNLAGAEIELLGINEKEYILKNAVDYIRDDYDFIIIDCPPLGLVIDAAIIGHQSDGAIIVVEAGKTKYRLVQNVKDQLDNSGVSVLGVVLNKVERKNQKGYYNKYYGSQKYEGYYGHNEETKNA